MTLTYSVKTDFARLAATLPAQMRSQVAFASALALTRLAQAAQREVTAQLDVVFDRPNPFTKKAIAIITASKTTLTSSVYIRPAQAKYLRYEIAGGTILPARLALPVPVDYPLNEYGGLPQGVVKRLLARPDVFSGTVHGHPGIFQRKGMQVIMLIGWARQWRYDQPRLDFAGIVKGVIEQQALPIFGDALRSAIATMRL